MRTSCSGTPATIVTMPLLKDELRKVVRAGYAINRGEWREGVGGLAVALFNNLDQPVAAVGISGPLDRLSAADEAAGAGRGGLCAGDIPGHGVSRRLPGTVAPASASAAAMRRAWSRARRAFTSMDVVQKVPPARLPSRVIAGCTTPPASSRLPVA